ncbi:hypothetical protein [Salinispora arenicola]|uniref:hypothetical protein n=1 Tax=Salinispora arenicola TaxID=168697 RepID=UPI000399FBAB|nr:hypothetical protein [Salinispora arenicola]
MLVDRDAVSVPFAGELFLRLAEEDRLVIDAARADAAIAALERALSAVQARVRVLRRWQRVPVQRLDDLPDALADDIVHAAFADQLAPGRLEHAEIELPKYIDALRRARRPGPTIDDDR